MKWEVCARMCVCVFLSLFLSPSAPLLSSDVKINWVVSMLSARETEESVQYHLEGFGKH